jgi:hypothetical protein
MSLTPYEQDKLANCEHVIEHGLQTFVDVGESLLTIRDDRLYRATHGTFEDYCHARWGFTDRRARQIMAAAEIGTIVPVANEGQARALAPCFEFMRKYGDDRRHELRDTLHLDASCSLLVGNLNHHRTAWLVICVLRGIRAEKMQTLFELSEAV